MGFKFFQNLALDVSSEGKHQLYNTVGKLKIEAEHEKENKKNSLEIRRELEQLHIKLTLAMDGYDKATESNFSLKNRIAAFQSFAEECHTAIFAHQTQLMAAPGFLNKLQAIINNFFEQYFALAPIFDITRSDFGTNVEFSKKFNDVKRELTPQSSDEDGCCFSM